MPKVSLFAVVVATVFVAGCKHSGTKLNDAGMSSCVVGSTGCECNATGACDENGAFCNSQRKCALPAMGCAPGALECPCAGGGCNAGLRCVDNVCRDNTGFEGGACLPNAQCHTGNRCSSGICVRCTPGAQGCTCRADGCDDTLACDNGMCVTDTGFANSTPPPTDDSSCVTPCSAGLVAPNGTYVACPESGVMPGCLPGLTCQSGQCLCAGSTPRSCTADIDCADFHACIHGICRTNCQADSHCRSDATCFRNVCRKRCDATKAADCPGDTICHPADGQAGVCLLRSDSAPAPTPPEAAELTLGGPALRFTPKSATGKIDIQNVSAFDAKVVIRKLRERQPGKVGADPLTLELPARETAPSVDSANCPAGSRGCRCGSDSGNPCNALSGTLSLSCDSKTMTCQLPTCSTGTPGCVCQGSDCRQLCESGRCPLAWLTTAATVDGSAALSEGTDTVRTLTVPAGKTATLTVGGPEQAGPWSGALEIESLGEGGKRQELALSFANTPEGRWAGQMYYFGSFPVSDTGLATWRDARATLGTGTDADKTVRDISNAFLEKWANFRRGLVDFKTINAVMLATREESWRSPLMTSTCLPPRICYPDDSFAGYDEYTHDSTVSPVPSGVVQMPIGLNLTGSGAMFTGAIDSSVALQYPGFPALTLVFDAEPASCAPGKDGNCLSFLKSFAMTSIVGGRYAKAVTDCPASYQTIKTPWLVPGFVGRSKDEGGRRYVTECRAKVAPITAASDPEAPGRNGDIAAANPFLDGKARSRTIELLDGVSVNGDTMVLLFRETTPPLVPSTTDSGVNAYGFMTLHRDDSTIDSISASPAPAIDPPPAEATPSTGCRTAKPLLDLVGGQLAGHPTGDDLLTDAKADWPSVARGLLYGTVDAGTSPTMLPTNTWTAAGEKVHYLCEDSRQFDGSGLPCPTSSPITYFTTADSYVVSSDACQTDHSCSARLNEWLLKGGIVLQLRPNWRCAIPVGKSVAPPTCDDSTDLRKGKEFFAKAAQSLFIPLRNAVDEAFRYRTRFADRAGTNLGFVPQICGQGQQTLPYCYTPADILALEQRHDCLLEIVADHWEALSADTYSQLRVDLITAIREAFSYREEHDPDLNISTFHPGFEKLRSELLIMLGDDAFVKALGSRFDLAGLGIASFEGTLFESNGINLSGVAGAEMVNLYLSTQYYSMVAERLAAQLPRMWAVIENTTLVGTGGTPIIGVPTVVEYVNRVIRASTQRTRISGEIAKRYQGFDRANNARRVIERAYVSGYLDSMVLTTFMQTVARAAKPEDKVQVRDAIWRAQTTYRVGLSDMAEQLRGVTDDVNFFGFPRDYIPFPALETQAARDTAFDVANSRAKELMNVALAAEDLAISSTRSFDTDAVSFQNELTRISNTYEAQLSEICGTFTDSAGVVHPAISRYAHLFPAALQPVGDPCGRTGTGALWDSILQVDEQDKEILRVRTLLANVNSEAENERQRISAICGVNATWEKAIVDLKSDQYSVQTKINDMQQALGALDRVHQGLVNVAQFTPCTIGLATDCPGKAAAGIAVAAEEVIFQGTAAGLDGATRTAQLDLERLQNKEATISFQFMCNDTGKGTLQIDSATAVKNLLLQIAPLQVEAARAELQLQQAIAHKNQLRNQARRIAAEMEENFQLTIDLEAARNDPNIRIYRNDSVIQSDVTFQAALREAYRATRVYEYYTSQSYPDRDKLLLSRLVSRGDYNLQAYLLALQESFNSFEDSAGVPDLRVLVLSLRDNLLKLPYTNACGEAVAAKDRIAELQRQLSDPGLLDSNGYIVVPFRIGPEQTSPLTRNHKLRYLEAQLIGGSGDQVARVYVRAAGTSMVSTLGDELSFYTFPKRTGVINMYFASKNSFDLNPEVLHTNRFADRPLMNSRWELVLNMKDEPANLDYAIKDISDIRLYFYYTDFTKY